MPRLSPATGMITKNKLPWQLRSDSCFLQDPALAELCLLHTFLVPPMAGGGRWLAEPRRGVTCWKSWEKPKRGSKTM